MPIYEYKCQKCQAQFESLVLSSSGELEVTCPKCGAGEVNKLMSAFSGGSQNKDFATPASSCSPGKGFS